MAAWLLPNGVVLLFLNGCKKIFYVFKYVLLCVCLYVCIQINIYKYAGMQACAQKPGLPPPLSCLQQPTNATFPLCRATAPLPYNTLTTSIAIVVLVHGCIQLSAIIQPLFPIFVFQEKKLVMTIKVSMHDGTTGTIATSQLAKQRENNRHCQSGTYLLPYQWQWQWHSGIVAVAVAQ